MIKKNNKKIIFSILLMSFLFVLMATSFNKNILFESDAINYNKYRDSEQLIINKCIADELGYDTSSAGAMGIDENGKYVKYKSGFLIQGHIFSFLYNKCNIPISGLKNMCVVFLALVIVMISYLIYIKYNVIMAFSFYIVSLLSPFITMFASNLFFMEIEWFFPMLIMLIIFLDLKNTKIKITGYFCLFFSILMKVLTSYEYLSTILVCGFSFSFTEIFTCKKEDRKSVVSTFCICVLIALSAFVIGFLSHASIRGDTIIEGIKDIWENDIQRRTFGSAADFNQVYADSLNATILDVLKKYIFDWTYPIMGSNINSNFSVILDFSVFISLINVVIGGFSKTGKEKEYYLNKGIMFFVFFVGAISWFILAKAHSYIHTHMNFVVWYLGFMQILFYAIVSVSIDSINILLKMFGNSGENSIIDTMEKMV